MLRIIFEVMSKLIGEKMSKHEGYIYICSFDNGDIKVGMSERNPQSRVKTHKAFMKNHFNTNLVNFWCSELHHNFKTNEKKLIVFISKHTIRNSNEWCNGLSFSEVMSFATGLEYIKLTKEGVERLDKKFSDNLDEMFSKFNAPTVEVDPSFIQASNYANLLYNVLITMGGTYDIDSFYRKNVHVGFSDFILPTTFFFWKKSEKYISLVFTQVPSLPKHLLNVLLEHIESEGIKNIQQVLRNIGYYQEQNEEVV